MKIPVCIPIREKNPKKILRTLKREAKKGDMFEIWLPHKPLDFQKLRSLTKKPLILAVKRPEEKVLKILEQALKAGINWLDLDVKTKFITVKRLKKKFPKAKFMISWHDFKSTPTTPKLLNIYNTAEKFKPDFVKIVPTGRTHEDIIRFIKFCEKIKQQGKRTPLLGFCMGKKGRLTRWMSLYSGAPWLYTAQNRSKKTADGQITLEEIIKILK